jgi:hypothetical protein
MKRFNERFAVVPAKPVDLHRHSRSQRIGYLRLFSPVSARVARSGLQVKYGYFVDNTPTSAVLCSRRRLRPLSTLNPCHSPAAVLACSLNDRYLFSVSVVARANAGIRERAGGLRLLDLQRGSTRRRLRDVQSQASPAISETYNINPIQMAELVDREENIWFEDTRAYIDSSTYR